MRPPVPLPRPAWMSQMGNSPLGIPPLPLARVPAVSGARPPPLPSASAGSVGPLGQMFGLKDNGIYRAIKDSHVLDSLAYGLVSAPDFGSALGEATKYSLQMRPTWREEDRTAQEQQRQDAARQQYAQTLRGWGPDFADMADALEAGAVDIKDVWGPSLQMKGQRGQQAQDREQSKRYAFMIRDPQLREQVASGAVDYKTALDYERQNAGGYRPLTPDEADAYGLDSTEGYQVNGEGNIDKIGGSGTTISMPPGESAYDKALGEGNAKRALEFQDGAVKGTRALTTLGMMEQAVKDPSFYSGTLAENAVLPLKRAAASLGIDPNGVTSMETFNALSKQAALDVMGGSLGTGFSNADRDFVISQVPNLGNSPEGNAQLISVQKALAQRQIEISQLAEMYAKENGGRLDGGFYQFIAQWAEENPLFVAGGTGPAQGGAPSLPDPFGMR